MTAKCPIRELRVRPGRTERLMATSVGLAEIHGVISPATGGPVTDDNFWASFPIFEFGSRMELAATADRAREDRAERG
jgi:hypothetical protein